MYHLFCPPGSNVPVMTGVLDDEWSRSVAKIITLWLVATAAAGVLLLTVVRDLFV